MAKRFIDTDLFKKSFFRGLSAPHKLLWIYILTDCNHAGIWEVDFEIAKMRCGCDDLNEVKEIFKDKIVEFDNGLKWFIPSFIEFQYCELSEHNKAHISVLKLLNQYKLMGHLGPLQGAKDKDKVQDKDMDKEKDKDKDQKKLFRNSEFFQFEKFATEMGLKGWPVDKSTYYHQAMLDWSDGITSAKKNPQKAIDWIRTALAWERRDKQEGGGFYKNQNTKADQNKERDLKAMQEVWDKKMGDKK